MLYSSAVTSPWAAASLLALAALAFARPVDAVAVVVALSPFITYAVRTLFNIPGNWAEPLVLAVAAGWCARQAWRPTRTELGRLALPTSILSAIVVASAAVQLSLAGALLSDRSLASIALEIVGGYHVDTAGIAKTIHEAARLLEGIFLMALVVTVARAGRARAMLVRLFVLGASATALLNLVRIVSGALRRDALGELPVILRSIRLSLSYSDVNAAGSYFAIALFAAAGLVSAARRPWHRTVALAAAGLCASGVWISGSRSAVVAVIAVFLVSLLWSAGGRTRLWLILPAAIGSLLVLWVFPNPVFSASVALSIRYEMIKAALRMWQVDPLFGVGVGQFFERSGEFIRDESVRVMYPHENAHNNFLQLAAELGLIGIAVWFWVLLEAARAVRAGLGVAPDRASLRGAAAGIAAFLVTCAGGHPLLLSEVSIAFWMVLGVLAASGPSRDVPSPRTRRAAGIVIGCLALSIPVRAMRAISTANYENVSYGLSKGERDPGGTRFQRATGADITLFVPRTAAFAELPYRLEKGKEPVTVELHYRDRIATVLTVDSDTWRVYRLVVVPRSSDPRYIPLRLVVTAGRPEALVLGRLSVHERSE